MADETVYVIDDDESVRKALARLFRSVGLEVEAFSSAQDFLGCELPDRPCCLVLDVRMPGSSGLDLQQALNRRERSLPIIFITGYGDVPMSVRAMKAGAVDFLEKPFNDQQLLDVVHDALARDLEVRQQRRQQEQVQQRYESLTPREKQVMALVVDGLLNKQIAWELGISEKTVKVHRARVMVKMEADSLPHLVRLAEQTG